MTSPRPGPRPGGHAGPPTRAGAVPASELVVVDQRASRIRRPTDLLRSVISALGIILAAGIGLLAHATAAGVEIDAVGAGRRLPDTMLTLFGVAAAIALLLLPVALAIRQLSRRQPQQLVEAVLTGAGTIGLVALVNTAMRHGAAAPLYDAIRAAHPGASTTGPLDGYLAGLIAYTTIIGLTSPSRWRTGLWLAVGVYAVASLAKSEATVLSLVITLLLGRAIGLAVRYAAGSWSQRPSAEQIAAALGSVGQAIAAIRRVLGQEGFESRRYVATMRDGGNLDVRVFDRDQEAAGAAYRLYRWVRLQGQARRGMPFSLERTVERQALLAYAADEAGVRTPRLRALTRVGADAFALAHEHPDGTTLAEFAASPDGSGAPTPAGAPQSQPSPGNGSEPNGPAGSPANGAAGSQRTAPTGTQPAAPAAAQPNASGNSQSAAADDPGPNADHNSRPDAASGSPANAASGPQSADCQLTDEQLTDDQLRRVWETVRRLHAHRVTHRALTADRIMFADDGGVVLLDPGLGDVAATDLQLRLDLAQLLAQLALLVGPHRAADLAAKGAEADERVAVAALLQPIVLSRSTRTAVRRRKDVLPELRKQLLAGTPDEDVPPVRLERVRARTVVTLIASLAAGYLLLGQLGRVSLLATLRTADWRWTLPALALSALTYVGAAWSLSGYVPERLRFAPLALAQLAGSFVTLVTPAAVGGVALNIRYLQRRKIPAPVAAACVGLSQVVAFVLHIALIVVFVAITGSQDHSLRPPTWAYFVIAALVVIVLIVVAIPAGRRLLGARLTPIVGQVIPRLLAVVQQPRKLAEGIGGTLFLTACYVLCLAACIRALGGSVPIASTAVVYLTGSALGSAVPTPGGLGAVEAALSAGLTAAGLPGATAVSAVLLYRTLTFWLPVPLGWGAFNFLERRHYL